MAPKKARKYGRKKNGKTKDETDKVSELDKEKFNVQIESLSNKIQGLQIRCQELELLNRGYENELQELTANKRDIVSYLQSVSSKRADEIQELVERLEGMRQAREADHKAHDVQLGQLKLQYRETIDQLTSENIVLSGRLASLEEFKAHREETIAKIEELQNELRAKDEGHREEIRLVEKNRILEKDELKREMSEKLEEIGKKFRQMSSRQMAETTRRAIEENVALTSQMDTMEQKITAIVAENQNLIDVKQKQQVQISTLEGMERDLHKRNLVLSKIVKEQESKLREQETVASNLQPYHEKSIRLECDLSSLRCEVRHLRSECERLQLSCEKSEAKLAEVRNSYDAVCVKQKSVETILRSASSTLRDGIVFRHQRTTDTDRNDTLSSLLDILNVTEVPSDRVKLPLLSSNPAKRSESSESRYLSGDAGIVPLTTMLRHRRRTQTVATQTTKPPHGPPDLLSSRLLVKSAAYKILHEVKCPTKNFYDSRNSSIPRSRILGYDNSL